MFRDPQLSAYLTEALTNNWDVKIAAARVLQAEAAARRIFRSRWACPLAHGLLHADPNPGNFLVQPGVVACLDYGCTVVLEPAVGDCERRLWRALLTNEFHVEFVASHSERALPTLFKISALWGLPRDDERTATGMAGAQLGWTGSTSSLMVFLRGFVDSHPWGTPDQTLSLIHISEPTRPY